MTPSRYINIEDVSMKGAPVRFFGTADAYADITPPAVKDPPDAVALTVEENNLQLQNVSDRTIRKMIVLAQTTDVRGNHLVHVRHFLDNNKTKGYPPGYNNKALATMKFPSGREHVMTGSRMITQTEYRSKPYVQPRAEVYIVYALFADGSEWIDADRFDSLPQRLKDEIQAHLDMNLDPVIR